MFSTWCVVGMDQPSDKVIQTGTVFMGILKDARLYELWCIRGDI